MTLDQAGSIQARAEALYRSYRDRNWQRTSRVFSVLMAGQWASAVAVALLWSPYGWVGKTQSVHVHVWVAFFLGGAIASAPLAFILTRPTAALTRHVVAVAQMLWSALLIHLSGGRIETHFHAFGSLAFLAFYRDWRVLVTATAVVVADHLVRGVLWPESVYGIPNPEWWRFVEHAFWVVFENVVLVLACLRGVQEARLVTLRQAEAEHSLEQVREVNRTLDHRVAARTRELSETNVRLQESLQKLNDMQRQLVEASRQSGMAEVATAVLHNVGNVLNSVNVSAGVLAEQLDRSRVSGLGRLAALLSEGPMGAAIQQLPRGKQLAAYVSQLGEAVGQEREAMRSELDGLKRNVDHIKVIVHMQQQNARVGGMLEPLRLQDLLADAVRVSQMSLGREHVQVAWELEDLPAMLIDRHKVFQIVMNLLSNARHAIRDSGQGEGRITIRLRTVEGGKVRMEVQDTGCGLTAENAARLFRHGFTTKKDGHGFGLHASACKAMEMGGTLQGRSEGPGLGATFVLELPGLEGKKEAPEEHHPEPLREPSLSQ